MESLIDRYWFLTWRTYGTWLPGDERGFVDPVIDELGNRVTHNIPGTPFDTDVPALLRYSKRVMRGDPVVLDRERANSLLAQFQETATYRGWELVAVSVMSNHVHLIVGVPGDPDPMALMRDFKSYGSRRLNREWATPAGGSWWAESGSRRLLKSEENVIAAAGYVTLEQDYPLASWCHQQFRASLVAINETSTAP